MWLVVFNLISSLALAAQMPALSPGECAADPDAKIYFSSILANARAAYDRIKSEIGLERLATLQDTDSSQHYFCQITCQNRDGQNSTFWMAHSDSPSRAMDMNAFLCTGIRIENVQIVGSVYGPQPVIEKFKAVQSQAPEVHNWLIGQKFELTQIEYRQNFEELKKTLHQVSLAYLNSGSPVLRTAGVDLYDIAVESERGLILISEILVELREQNWVLEQNLMSPNYYVLNLFRVFGRFLEYMPNSLEQNSPQP